MRHLNQEALKVIPATVPVPGFDRRNLTTGIVHLGVGGFHRAHEAMYVDRLLSQGMGEGWGICGVGVLPQDRRMKEVLRAQQGLYTLMIRHSTGVVSPRVIGSLVSYLWVPEDPEAVVEKLAARDTHIVSLTITEGCYTLPSVLGEVDPRGRAIQHDLRRGATPTTVYGLVVEALSRRRDRGLPPFTVMSCDNIEGNGEAARRVFSGFARLKDPALADWIEEHVAFPNSMVDRITPSTSDADREEARTVLGGVVDGWPVVCEPFAQWVLENTAGGLRPPWEDAGVQLVGDVRPYELMKLRLLNASHQLLCYLGYLAGHRHVHEVAQDPLFSRYVRRYMDEEATPTLAPVPGMDLDLYKSTLVERFCNPTIGDTLTRICAETSDRIPKFLLPVVTEQLAAGGDVRLSALGIAAWARYAEGLDEQGRPIDVVDPLRTQLMAAARDQAADPLAFLRVREVFGDLADNRHFADVYVSALASLHRVGARRTLEDLLEVSAA
jgi:mannitol 2-dehydrogenase